MLVDQIRVAHVLAWKMGIASLITQGHYAPTTANGWLATIGNEVMDTTKTKLRQRISVPDEVMQILRWHVDTQLTTPEQQASDLLFPARDGAFLNEHCLRQPFAKVSPLIGLEMHFTPRGLRRTFNDLARAAHVEALVTKSISGHQTDRMREHYSTVQPLEQRRSIGAVLRLVKGGGGTV